jgi:CheY-like chemotaxis protein
VALSLNHFLVERLKNKRILIVDDHLRNTFALTSYLESLDMIIFEEENGETALQYLQNNPEPDVILLDMMMPVMDGYETLAVLKSDERFRHIPVIAVTANAMKGDREKCLEAGAWDYISKPIDLRQLIDKLNRWIL